MYPWFLLICPGSTKFTRTASVIMHKAGFPHFWVEAKFISEPLNERSGMFRFVPFLQLVHWAPGRPGIH